MGDDLPSLTNAVTFPPSLVCRIAARVMCAGAVALGALSLALPFAGPQALAWYRGRGIAAPAAQAILPRLLLLISLALLCTAALWWSAGRLLALGTGERGGEARKGISWTGWLAALVPAALFAAVLLVLGGRSFNYDEIAELVADVRPKFLQALNSRAFINQFSGSFMARVGVHLGTSELLVRLPGILMAVAAFATSTILLARIKATVAFTAGAIMAAHPLLLAQTAQIRGYAALYWMGLVSVLLVSIALLEYKSYSRRLRVIYLSALGIATCLLGVSHLFGLLWLATLCILVHLEGWAGWSALGARDSNSPRVRDLGGIAMALSATFSISLLYWIPSFPWLFYYGGNGGSARPRLGPEALSLLTGNDAASPVYLVLAVGVVASAVTVFRHCPWARILVLLAMVPTAGAFVAAVLFAPTFFYARFLGLGAALSAVVVGLAIAIPSNPWARALLRGLVVAFVLIVLAPGIRRMFRFQPGNREVAARLLEWRKSATLRGGLFVPFGGWQAEAVASYYIPSDLIRRWDSEWSSRRRAEQAPDCFVSVGPWPIEVPTSLRTEISLAPIAESFPIPDQSPLRCWCYE